jgi:exosome complex RNA-binding protein Rrp4
MATPIVIPGEIVGDTEKLLPGTGTYIRGSDIRASQAGRVTVSPAEV